MDGSKLCLARGKDGTGFYRFSVLGSAEDERCHAGPRFSPRHDLFSSFHKLPSDTDCPNATVPLISRSQRLRIECLHLLGGETGISTAFESDGPAPQADGFDESLQIGPTP